MSIWSNKALSALEHFLGGMSRNTAREHFLKSSPLDLGQRRLGFWEPKGHLHDPIEADRRRQLSTGLLLLAGRGIQRAQATMAVGHDRTHAEFFGEGERLLVAMFGWLGSRGLLMGGDLPEEPQGPRLVPPLLMGTGEVESTLSKLHCLLALSSC